MKKLLNKKLFEEFIYNSFEGSEQCHRELRLSNEEKDYLKLLYPNAIITLLPEQEPSDKQWYDIEI